MKKKSNDSLCTLTELNPGDIISRYSPRTHGEAKEVTRHIVLGRYTYDESFEKLPTQYVTRYITMVIYSFSAASPFEGRIEKGSLSRYKMWKVIYKSDLSWSD
jgi:hypothetical protein